MVDCQRTTVLYPFSFYREHGMGATHGLTSSLGKLKLITSWVRESERERVYAAASELVRKEKGEITPAREMKIRRGLEGGEGGAGSQLNPRCLSWSF